MPSRTRPRPIACRASPTPSPPSDGPRRERHVIPEPARYRHYREAQPYSLTIDVHGGEIYAEESGRLEYRLYDRMPGTKGGLWTYRRLLAAELFGARAPHDLTLFNWPGNDYRDRSIIDRPAAEVAASLQDAKRVSLGFLHWLQTEAPTTADRRGAPEIMLRPDAMGTADGLSKHPYIRESRRIVALKTIVEAEVSAQFQPGPVAAPFADSVGIGWYPIDIHRSGDDDVGLSCRTRPFQIPLGALIPVRVVNLIAACKNIGTHPSHQRLLPAASGRVEHRRGGRRAGGVRAAAGPLAGRGSRRAARRRSSRACVDEGVPLAWPESLR